MKRIVLLGAALLAGLVACGRGPAPSQNVPAGTPPLIDLAELARDPAAYEGHWVRVTGAYGELPLPLCAGALRLSPATWGLSGGGVVLRLAGLEGVVHRLATNGLHMTVEGQWQRWEGPIGCGWGAVESVIWYLKASQILMPNPLVAATLTPRGVAQWPVGTEQPAAIPGIGTPSPLPSPTQAGPLSPLATPTDFRSPLATPVPTPSATTSYPLGLTPTAPFSPIASPTLTPTPSETPDFWATSTGTPLATYTQDVNSSPISTPTLSPTPTPSGTSDQGYISTNEIRNGVLAAGVSHRWFYYGQAGNRINVMAGPAAGIDTEITIYNPAGTRLLMIDNAAAGQMDMVEDLELTQTGNYQIIIRDVDGDSGAYGLSVTAVGGLAIVFSGNLNYGDGILRNLPADTYHIWHFQGTAGDWVTISVNPQEENDIQFDLYGPAMGDPLRRVDASGPAEPEETTVQLTVTGFYSILIREYSGQKGYYVVELSDS